MHGGAECPLDRRENSFRHGSLAIAITVHAGVVGVIERRIDTMLDQGTNTSSSKFVSEGFRVIATVCSQQTQIGRIPAGDLRPNLCIVLLCCRAVEVADV